MTADLTPKKARRDDAREKARIAREEQAKKKRRSRLIIQGGVIAAAIAIAAVVVLVVASLNKPPAPGPLNMLSDGIVLQQGDDGVSFAQTKAIAVGGKPVASTPSDDPNTVSIVTYIDYQCPICKQFEEANAAFLQEVVESGMATVEVHPLGFLDSQSLGNRYASRAANAAACVANFEPEDFFAVNNALFVNQPAEGTSGMKNSTLKEIVASGGADSDDVASCIDSETFRTWVSEATDRTKGPVPNSDLERITGTPTVLVDGQQYTGNPGDSQAFVAFVTAIATAKAPASE